MQTLQDSQTIRVHYVAVSLGFHFVELGQGKQRHDLLVRICILNQITERQFRW